jgi:AGZA family xanthine/uracil permease-like MFS transporter
MDMFDTVGTIIGVGEQAGFIKDNRLPRADRALLSDAVATVAGSCAGTSTVTSYIESAVGVQYGARTGLASVATGFFFLIALLFTPLVAMIGGYAPITAPALVIVGAMMVRNVFKIDFDDWSEAVPAFLMIIGIPLTFTIHNGMAIGFIAYPIIKILSGKGKEASWLMYLVAILFILRYALVKI